jgi:hypothetical protein
MINVSRHTIAAIASVCGLVAILGIATEAPAAENENIAQVLRTGGFVIVVRHGATPPAAPQRKPLNRLRRVGMWSDGHPRRTSEA